MKTETKPQSYAPEFRESAVKLAIDSDQPVSQTARELGINVNTLHNWLNKYRGQEKKETEPAKDEHLYDELKRLRREIKRVTEERDILKKATAYFAKESV